MQNKLKNVLRLATFLTLFMVLVYNANGITEAASENSYVNDISIDSSSASSFTVQLCTRTDSVTGLKFTTTANSVSNTLTYSPTIAAGKCVNVGTWGFSYFGVKEGQSYTVKVQIANSTTSYSESLTIPTTSNPDLKISDITMDTNSIISVKSTNEGNKDVDSSTKGATYIYIDDVLKYTYSWSTLADLNFLKVGGVSTIQPSTLTSGKHTVKACVDATYIVAESDESDNCKSVSLGTDAQPDLKLSDITMDSTSLLSIKATNEGKKDVDSTTKGYTYIYIDNTLKYTYSWTTLSDKNFLKVGGVSTIQPGKLPSGKHTVKACVDATYIVAESDESDNCKSVTLGTDAQPDLKVSDITIDSTSLLSIKSTNEGNKDVDSTTKGYTYIYIDDVLNYSYAWTNLADKNFLKIGGVSTLQPGKLASGKHTVKACVDSTYIVTESDEVDNCKSVSLGADPQADLTVNSISLDKNSYLTITMKNEGNKDVDSTTKGSTYIYLDDVLTWVYDWANLTDKSFLKAGGTSTIQTGILSGKHTIKACVDSTYFVSESNETNNCKTVSF